MSNMQHSKCNRAKKLDTNHDFDTTVAMQQQKLHQEKMNLEFSSPLLALLLAVWPWHPRAIIHKAADRAVAQVRHTPVQLLSACMPKIMAA